MEVLAGEDDMIAEVVKMSNITKNITDICLERKWMQIQIRLFKGVLELTITYRA